MRVGIHQPNFIPWLPFFYKMAMCDEFVLLNHVQFEKNGFQNRFKYQDKWITKPVKHGLIDIVKKEYTDGKSLENLNRRLIYCLAEVLSIKTRIITDDLYHVGRSSDPTGRLIDILNDYYLKKDKEVVYITNPSAKDKYLDESRMRDKGIKIEYCRVPKHLQISYFEALEKYGIEGIIKQLPRWKV